MKNLCFNPWFLSEYDNRTGKTYKKVTVNSYQNKIFTQYEHMLYRKENGKRIKYINKDLISRIEPLGLTIWFMDDGSKYGSGLSLATNCFSDEDLEEIRDMFLYKYNIEIRVNKYHVILFKKSEAIKLYNLIKDYIHDDCKYKVEHIARSLQNSVNLGTSQVENPNLSTTEMQ